MVNRIRMAFLFTIVLILTTTTGVTDARAQSLRVMTWNIAHGDNPDAQANFIAAQEPDVLILQEVNAGGQHLTYKALLDQKTGKTWNVTYKESCDRHDDHDPNAPNPVCVHLDGDGVAILSTLALQDTPSDTLLWGRDDWTDARRALRVKVRVGTQDVQVFGTHLAAGAAYESVRINQMNALKDWMDDFTGPRILGGDLNAVPGSAPMQILSAGYVDAWATVRPSETGTSSFTHSVSSLTRRIDYWFSETGSAAQPFSVDRPLFPGGPLSDHYAVVAVYTFGSTPGQTPFGSTPAAVPGRIQAENFDEGGEGVAYHDDTAGNSGGQHRPASDVDIEGTSDTGGGFNVGWLTAGEWLEYTVDVAATSNYTLHARVASTGDGGSFHVEVGPANVTGSMTVPNTGGWQNWTTVSKSGIHLTAGQHVIRFSGDANGTSSVVGNLNWLELVPGAATTALPGVIQAEEFDQGGEGVGYHDLTPSNLGGAYRPSEAVDIEVTADTGGGYNVGWFTAGEWLAYGASIQGGTYTITARVASTGAGGTFHIEVGGTDRTGPITVPDTGGWQAWQTVTKTGVILPSGSHTVKVVADTNGPVSGVMGNLNSLQFTLESSPTELLADTFDSSSLDTNKWSIAVMSGFQDTNVPVTQSNGQLNIGPLLQDTGGSHYNGILSNVAYDLTGASVRVRAVAVANSGTAGTASFTLPSDSNNHYRMFAEAGLLYFEKKVGGAKTNFSIAFDPVQHAFWRIRHDTATDELVWETAPDAGGAPGTWTERRRMLRDLSITAMRIELKAGTWKAETSAPGTVVFDNLLAVRP